MSIGQLFIIGGNIAVANPNILPGVQVWYNADIANSTNFGSNVPTNGGGVKTWTDRSNIGHDANQSVANKQPTWNSNQKNGYGTIRFDGSNDLLSINPLTGWAVSLGACCIFMVARSLALSGTPTMTTSDTGGFNFSWNTNWQITAASGTGTSSVPGDTTNYHLFTLLFDGSQTGNDNRLKFRYDGAQQTLNFGATTVGTTTSAGAGSIYMGCDQNTANFWNGEIAEYVFYNVALSNSQVSQAEAYFKQHWALSF